MYISIETNDLKATDANVLRAIADALDGAPTPTPAADVVKEDRKAEQAKAAPAKAAKKAAPAPDPDESGDDPTEAAVERATALVKGGKTAVVKKALAEVGVKRVSELSAEHVEDFLAALDAAEIE